MSPILLVVLFAASAVLGYLIIRNVPALLHTPLMSGMNALSGITVLGAMVAAASAKTGVSLVLALLAGMLAMVNVAGGFALTHRMLSRFARKEEKRDD